MPSRDIFSKTGDKLEFGEISSKRSASPGRSPALTSPASRIGRFPSISSRSAAPARSARRASRVLIHYTKQRTAAAASSSKRRSTVRSSPSTASLLQRVASSPPSRAERIAIKAGVSVKGRTYRHPSIERIVRDVVERSGLQGPANVQGMLREDGSFSISK